MRQQRSCKNERCTQNLRISWRKFLECWKNKRNSIQSRTFITGENSAGKDDITQKIAEPVAITDIVNIQYFAKIYRKIGMFLI